MDIVWAFKMPQASAATRTNGAILGAILRIREILRVLDASHTERRETSWLSGILRGGKNYMRPNKLCPKKERNGVN
jgi:hypothetical protein